MYTYIYIIYFKGGAKVQAVSAPNADGDIVVRASGGIRCGQIIHSSGTEDDIEAVSVSERYNKLADKSDEQDTGRGGFLGSEGRRLSATLRGPPSPATEGSAAAGNDAPQCLEAPARLA